MIDQIIDIFSEWIELVKILHEQIMIIYNGNFDVYIKEDKSPVTIADKIVSDMIENFIIKNYPQIPILCEEKSKLSYEERVKHKYIFIVDPIDGTKEFINKNGEFTVNIGLCYKGEPIFGIVSIPTYNILYYGLKGYGSYKINLETMDKNIIKVKKYNKQSPLIVLGSKSHMDKDTKKFIDSIENEKVIHSFGSSIKFMKIAEGEADLYVRLAPTMEWDTCASQIILEEAGGCLINYESNQKLVYNKKDLFNPYFIAANDFVYELRLY